MSAGFDRLTELFSRLRRIPPGDAREAALAGLADLAPDLRTRLADLLAQHDAADAEGFGLGLDGVAASALLDASSDEVAPALPGFRVVRRIGEGGMGTVWEAEQEHPRRRVAIKLLRPELATSEGRKRFEREADLLAGLSHPGIARIHQQGVADQAWGAQPFLAMEFVNGEPLTAYARRERLDLARRVELLVKVCDAVGHLHEHGVIHRDLKPGNILVTPDGAPKVLDFGIARALESGATLETRPGAVLGTLAYMSPEQATGMRDAADTRSDVYALGVLAYELLAGRLPYDLEGQGLPAAVRTIAERDPPSLGGLDTRLRGDLSAIVAKAMDKDKARRYASAAALGEDLRRHLADEVVLASRVSAIHLVRKFVRRHTAWVVGSAAVLAALIAGLVASLHLKGVADDEARAARAASRLARFQAAAAALANEEMAVLEEHLAAIPEATRGWAWRYLQARLEGYVSSETVPPGAQTASLAPDGTVLVARHTPGEARYRNPGETVWSDPFPVGSSVKTMSAIVGGRKLVGTSPLTSPAPVFDVGERGRFCEVDGSVIGALAGSADGRRVALQWAAPPGPTFVEVRDAEAAGPIWRAPVAAALVLALDPRGERLAVGAPEQALVFEVGGDAVPRRLRWDDGDCWAIAFSPDGTRLATGSMDRAIRLWDAATGEALEEIRDVGGEPRVLAFVDADRLAVGTADGAVRLWDRRAGTITSAFLGERYAILDVAARGDELVAISRGSLRRWWIGEGPPDVLAVHGRESRTRWAPFVYFAGFTPDGAHIVSGGWDGFVRVTDLATGEALAAIPTEFVSHMTMSMDARLVAAGAHELQLCDPATASLRGTLPLPTGTRCVSLTPDGRTLRFGLNAGRVETVDVASGASRGAVEVLEKNENVGGIAHDPRGDRFLAVGDRGAAAICLARDGAVLQVLQHGPSAQVCAAFAPGGDLVATGGGGGVARICRIADGRTIHVLEGHGAQVFSLAFSPDGTELATGASDGVVRIWEVATGELLLRLRGHTRYVKDVSFSPDGQTLLSASGDGTIRIWSARPFAERFAERRAVVAAEREMEPWVSARFDSGDSGDDVVAESAADPTLGRMQRHAVRNLVLKAAGR